MSDTTKTKALQILGWYREGSFPALFTDSVSVVKQWLEQGHKVSGVIRHDGLAVEAAPSATTQSDTLTRTGNTADHQAGWFAGVDHGRAEARASARDDAKEEDCDIPELRSQAEIGFEEWLTRQMPKGTVISNPAWWAPRILSAAMRSVRAKDHLVAAPADSDVLDADMYWNDADTEGFAGSTLDDAVRYVADDIPTSEMPVTLTFQVAKTLPNVQVLVTGVDSEGDLQYEVIDATIAAQQGKGGAA